jgi:glycosyltransferase involved in cell wall biosynthesis
MDRNYRYKYERIQKLLESDSFTTVDIGSIPSRLDPSLYALLLVGVFAAFPLRTDPPEWVVPPGWFHKVNRRCVMVEDLWPPRPGRDLAEFLGNKYQYLISAYDCDDLTRLCKRLSSVRKAYVIPHHIDTKLYKDRGLPKIYDVLFYGNTNPERYPFRNRLRRLLAGSRLKVQIIEHPGAHAFDEEHCSEGLARIINQSEISIATPAAGDYLVAKYFEISAAGSVVAGKMATQGQHIWKQNYVQLEEDMSDVEILDRLTAALKDKDSLQRKREVMGQVVRQEYSLDRYIERLTSVLKEINASPAGSNENEISIIEERNCGLQPPS